MQFLSIRITADGTASSIEDQKTLNARLCTQESVHEGSRMLPSCALPMLCNASIVAFFIIANKMRSKCARRNSQLVVVEEVGAIICGCCDCLCSNFVFGVLVFVSFSNNCFLVGCRIDSIVMYCECCKLH